jgi:siroheme synthase
VIGTLDDITEKAKLVPPPAVIVVGEVVGLVDDPVELVGAARPWGVAVHNGKPSASKS